MFLYMSICFVHLHMFVYMFIHVVYCRTILCVRTPSQNGDFCTTLCTTENTFCQIQGWPPLGGVQKGVFRPLQTQHVYCKGHLLVKSWEAPFGSPKKQSLGPSQTQLAYYDSPFYKEHFWAKSWQWHFSADQKMRFWRRGGFKDNPSFTTLFSKRRNLRPNPGKPPFGRPKNEFLKLRPQTSISLLVWDPSGTHLGILNGFQQILIGFWLDSGWILNGFRLDSEWILTAFWVDC